MKSAPRYTPVTPSSPNRLSASGELLAAADSVKLAVPEFITARPGRNLRVAGLGVGSVWMNIGTPDRWIGHKVGCAGSQVNPLSSRVNMPARRSEERRVGKECRSRWSLEH